MQLPANPLVYEIHTAAYLRRLSQEQSQEITLHTIPENELDKLKEFGVQAVWLMGVWQRSQAGTAITKADAVLMASLKESVPGLDDKDIIGSAYCIQNYAVDSQFGGNEGLRVVRDQLASRGIGLLLDFVPNHVAPDHSWILEHPDYFITADESGFASDPASFAKLHDTVFAKGKDPHFAAWPDVIQLNAFSPGYRQASIDTLDSISELCDGVRCDMAMLMTNHIFTATWQSRGVKSLGTEYWEEVISAVREKNPHFIFLAESYWDTEKLLLEQGFNYCYDKTLYDLLLSRPASEIREHINADKDYQSSLCHFIENHDEARAAAVYEITKGEAAAAAMLTLPGMRLVNDGQLEGYRVKIPVHVAKGPSESIEADLHNFYETLLRAVSTWQLESSEWHRYDLPNDRMLAWHWLSETTMHLVFINYSDQPNQCNAYLPNSEYEDALSEATLHSEQAVNDSFVVSLDLGPWEIRMFNVARN